MKSGDIIPLISIYDNQKTQYFVGVQQRNIEWTKKEFEKYHDDLINDADPKTNREHFMNSIIIKPMDHTKKFNYISTTDGQQRITMTYLHICAICAFVKNNNIPKKEFSYEQTREEFLINKNYDGNEHYKLFLRRKDRDTLKYLVDELPTPPSEKAGSPKVIRAYNYFYNKLTLDNYQETFDKLYYMTTLEITVEPHEDEDIIFDSINSTGRKVGEFDKCRGLTLKEYPPEIQEEFDIKYWDAISNDKSPISVLNSFLRKNKNYTLEGAYSNFKKIIQNYDNKEHLLIEINEFYEVYKQILNSNTGDDEIDWLLQGLNLVFPAGYMTPLIKIYQFYLDKQITYNTLINCFKLILTTGIRLVFRLKDTRAMRNVMELNISWVTSENTYGVLCKTLSPYFIDDSQFTIALQNKNMYKGKEGFEEEDKQIPSKINKITKYLLMSVENSHYPKGRINPETYNIEHICPQTQTDEWKHIINEEDHHDYVHSLGNLTLVAKSYNSAYSNKSFDFKKDCENGFHDDKLYLNKWLCDKTTWTVDLIKQRTNCLAGELCEVFKLPETNILLNEKSEQTVLMSAK